MKKRKFNRVRLLPIAKLILNDRVYENVKIKNLSITGVLIEGKFEKTDIFNECALEMNFRSEGFNLDLKLIGRVIRVEEDSVAFEFIYTDTESLILLETIILHHSDNPVEFAQEFPEDPPQSLDQGQNQAD